MDIDEQKRAAATAALEWLLPQLHDGVHVGIGTGSTADHLIDLLAPHRARFAGAVASSARSAGRLSCHGIRVCDLNDVGELPIYVDGADEITPTLEMTKGGGGALTREKIVAAASRQFVCIADESKQVRQLGAFPLPVEVIPMARAQVIRALQRLGDEAGLGPPSIAVRVDASGAQALTDNGNVIVDVRGWRIERPTDIEARIGAIVGVVESGLFALRGADILLLAGDDGVKRFERSSG